MSSNGANKEALIERDWFGCYSGSWGSEISPSSFEHPAKFSRGLIRRVYQHMMEQGYIRPGDFVVDPFGGVGLGARDAILIGLHWRGMELELKFQRLGQGMDCPGFSKAYYRRYNQRGDRWNALNICPDCGALLNKYIVFTHWFGQVKREIPHTEAHHYRGNIERWMEGPTARGTAVLLQGDSRQLAAVLGSADGCVSSPPYIDSLRAEDNTQARIERLQALGRLQNRGNWGGVNQNLNQTSGDGYGRSPGQLGAMPEGNHADAIVSSPPFGEGETRNRSDYQDGYVADMMSRAYTQDKQGTTPGNLAGMRADQEGFSAAVGSPPFQGSGMDTNESAGVRVAHNTQVVRKNRDISIRPGEQAKTIEYGRSPGQLGSMPQGDFDACLSSPPYADAIKNGEGPGARHDPIYHNGDNAYKVSSAAEYGNTPGNLGNLANGGFEAAVSSPPYENNNLSTDHEFIRRKSIDNATKTGRNFQEHWVRTLTGEYGNSNSQLGTEQGDTFWAAARQIVEQVYMVLRPGGYAAWVCKDFIRNKERVEFSNQWQALCEACGFVVVERIRAWIVEERGTQLGLFGEDVNRDIWRMSFFRRLHTKKFPHLAIKWEDVIIMRKA